MIFLGAMSAYTGWIRLTALEEAIKNQIPAKALEVSKRALRRGFEEGVELGSAQKVDLRDIQ
jgi:Pyruvate/2-oxoacid:ferredoxin oxidoreductase gamma subunit